MLRMYFNRVSAGGVSAAAVAFAVGFLLTGWLPPAAALDEPDSKDVMWNKTKAALQLAWERALMGRKEWLLQTDNDTKVSVEKLGPVHAEEAAHVAQRLLAGGKRDNGTSASGRALASALLQAGGEDVGSADTCETTREPDFRFQASLWWDRLESPLCGAAVVDERNLVTAAHCIYDGVMRPTRRPTNFLRVSAGSEDYQKAPTYEVGYTYTHPYFDTLGLDNDVAVVRLKKALTLGQEVRAIPLATSAPEPGAVCQLSGWGAWVNHGDPNATLLRHMDVVVQAPDACVSPRDRDVAGPLICVAAQNGDAYTHADDGGPLTCSGRLVGVVVRNGRKAYGVAVTDVSLHADFVAESLAHPGRGAWPFLSSVLAGAAIAAVCLAVTAVLARLSDGR